MLLLLLCDSMEAMEAETRGCDGSVLMLKSVDGGLEESVDGRLTEPVYEFEMGG